ncbi:hypothetical protein ACIQNU_25070 [Streptomyces sp. NPDC091292]|uniref:hypothetical protein n=1 Tax=Streptomyces sp. NPDC091292 TaxID=3365991 RepID=UPI003816C594
MAGKKGNGKERERDGQGRRRDTGGGSRGESSRQGGRSGSNRDPEQAASRTPTPPPESNASEQWYSPVANAWHYIAGSELMTSSLDAAGNAGAWVAERTPWVVDAAVDALQPAGLVAQGIGTALQDAGRGARSFYNWGVVLSGADGLRTVFLQGQKALKPHPNDPPDVLAAAMGAFKAGGAAAYAFGSPLAVQTAGAVVQGIAQGGEFYNNQRVARYTAAELEQAHARERAQVWQRATAPAPQLDPLPNFSNLTLTNLTTSPPQNTTTAPPQHPVDQMPAPPASVQQSRGRRGDSSGSEPSSTTGHRSHHRRDTAHKRGRGSVS